MFCSLNFQLKNLNRSVCISWHKYAFKKLWNNLRKKENDTSSILLKFYRWVPLSCACRLMVKTYLTFGELSFLFVVGWRQNTPLPRTSLLQCSLRYQYLKEIVSSSVLKIQTVLWYAGQPPAVETSRWTPSVSVQKDNWIGRAAMQWYA